MKSQMNTQFHHMEIRPQVIDAPEEFTEYDVVFDEIQDTVIQGIRDAKFYYMGSGGLVFKWM